MTYNKCPHPQCNELKAVVLFACKEHWHGLSETIRYKIYHGSRNKEEKHLYSEGVKLAFKSWGDESNEIRR